MKKRHISLILLTIISFTISQNTLSSISTPAPRPPAYPNISTSTLFKESSIVIQGIIESSNKAGDTENTYHYIASVIIDEYLKGTGPDKITVHYQNIKPETASRDERYYVYLIPDEEVVLCLQNNEDFFVLTYGVQGKFLYNDEVYVNINGRIWSPPSKQFPYLGFLFLLSIPTYIFMYRRLSK